MGKRGPKPFKVTDGFAAKVLMYRALGYTIQKTAKTLKCPTRAVRDVHAVIEEDLRTRWPVDVFKKTAEPLYRRA